MRRFLFLLVFALSATAALIYQIAWVRQATLVFGVSVYAYSAVLAAFMGGSALGSFVLRRWTSRTHPLRFYAFLQIGIALFGLLSPFALLWLMPVYAQIAQALSADSPLLTVVRTLFSILVLVPPTFLMGGTLPAMSTAFAKRNGQIGSDLARLYAADAIGAALGCALSALWLLHTLGTQHTVFVAVAINLLCAIVAWLIRQGDKETRREGEETAQESRTRHKSKTPPHPLTPSYLRFPLLAYALSGFAALGYEIVWARILAVFTLDAVYSFAIMLTTFLLGLCIGGWIATRWLARRRATLAHLGSVQLAIGVAALFTLLIFAWMPNLSLEVVFGEYSVGAAIAYEFLLGFLALLSPTILLGLVFPIVASLVTQEQNGQIAAQIGLASALNTSGAILGSLLVGFALIPLVGLKGSILTLAAINLCIGLAAHWLQQRFTLSTNTPSIQNPKSKIQNSTWWLAPALAALLAAVILVLAPPGYYLGFRADPGEKMVYYGEGVETTVAVFDVPEQNFKVSFVNGRIEVPTDKVSMLAFRLLGHLPALMKPDAQSALMLSFGNGVASGALALHKIPRIDAVDLSAEQFEAAERYWNENHNVLHSPRLYTHVEDGRNFLLQTSQQYDIITTDATHPSNSSSWALFTEEFYRSVAARLTPNGVFMQWSPFHSLLVEDYQRILRTFQQVFPHATLWYVGSSHTLLLATPDRLDGQTLNQLLTAVDQNEEIRADLEASATVRSYWVLDEDGLRAYAGTGELSTDDNAFFLPHNEETPKILQDLQGFRKP